MQKTFGRLMDTCWRLEDDYLTVDPLGVHSIGCPVGVFFIAHFQPSWPYLVLTPSFVTIRILLASYALTCGNYNSLGERIQLAFNHSKYPAVPGNRPQMKMVESTQPAAGEGHKPYL